MEIYNVSENSDNDILDFSVNVNSLGMPEGVRQAVINNIELCSFYPDDKCVSIRNALAKRFSIKPENIYCGNGADDIIFRIPIALKPQKALIIVPTYEEYKNSLEIIGCNINYFILEEKNGYKPNEDMLNAVTAETDIVYICNPNNPTGISAEISLIKKLAEVSKKNDAVLVIDESFIGFLASEKCSMKGLIYDYDNIIIIDAFTKLYCLPGFRLGYCISSNLDLLDKIKRSGPEFNVSIPAQAAGIAALEDENYIEKTKKFYSDERKWLRDKLGKLGLKTFDAEANYIFIKSPYEGFENKLFEKGIKVRYCGNFVGLNGEYIRIAIRTHEYNEKFLYTVKEMLI